MYNSNKLLRDLFITALTLIGDVGAIASGLVLLFLLLK